ncbi:MAG: hypothetical protein ABIK53_03705 [bacterium]
MAKGILKRYSKNPIITANDIRLGIWISYSPDLIFWGKSKPLQMIKLCLNLKK